MPEFLSLDFVSWRDELSSSLCLLRGSAKFRRMYLRSLKKMKILAHFYRHMMNIIEIGERLKAVFYLLTARLAQIKSRIEKSRCLCGSPALLLATLPPKSAR